MKSDLYLDHTPFNSLEVQCLILFYRINFWTQRLMFALVVYKIKLLPIIPFISTDYTSLKTDIDKGVGGVSYGRLFTRGL